METLTNEIIEEFLGKEELTMDELKKAYRELAEGYNDIAETYQKVAGENDDLKSKIDDLKIAVEKEKGSCEYYQKQYFKECCNIKSLQKALAHITETLV